MSQVQLVSVLYGKILILFSHNGEMHVLILSEISEMLELK